jgi:hypothetical protein
MPLFDILADAIGSPVEARVLDTIYSSMPTVNFSSDFLQLIPKHIVVMPLEGVQWSDWGRPERIVHSLELIHKQPAFPQALYEDQPIAGHLDQFLLGSLPLVGMPDRIKVAR